ncbi:MAG: ribosome maturation factor RimM [Candidatus Methylomirabilota bacterium]
MRSSSSNPEHLLVLGRILKPHGVRGEVRIDCFCPDPGIFGALRDCFIGPPGGAWQPVRIERARLQPRTAILKLAGTESPEAAAKLWGWELAIPREEAPEPPEGSFYHADLLGLSVTDGERSLGTVVEILETPAHDVFVVRGDAGEWMLPATRVHVRRIDLTARRIEILPMDGLLGAVGDGDGR